jgi:CDP-diglyceride synthetase
LLCPPDNYLSYGQTTSTYVQDEYIGNLYYKAPDVDIQCPVSQNVTIPRLISNKLPLKTIIGIVLGVLALLAAVLGAFAMSYYKYILKKREENKAKKRVVKIK